MKTFTRLLALSALLITVSGFDRCPPRRRTIENPDDCRSVQLPDGQIIRNSACRPGRK